MGNGVTSTQNRYLSTDAIGTMDTTDAMDATDTMP